MSPADAAGSASRTGMPPSALRLGKSSLYALTAALEMAHAPDGRVTVADLAARHAVPPGALAKALQALVHAGIAAGTRGVGGGYRLARPASAISVLDVVQVFQPLHGGAVRIGARATPSLAQPPVLGLLGLLAEVDEHVRCTFASVSLQTLARVRPRGGRARQVPARRGTG